MSRGGTWQRSQTGKVVDVGHVEVAHLSHWLPDGRVLIDDASFRVGEGTTAALVGPNGAGKTTLIRLVAGDVVPQSGTVSSSGGLGIMRQFVGGIRAGEGKRGSRIAGRSPVKLRFVTCSSLFRRRGCRRLPTGSMRPSWS